MGRREENVGAGDGAPTQLRGPVVSTGCLVVVLSIVFIVLVVAPAALWGLGIACGAR